MAKLSSNPNYIFQLKCADENIDVNANLPEKLDFSIEGDWESRFPMVLGDIFAWASGSFGSLGNIFFGGNVIQQKLSILTWQGTSPVTVNLELLFDAETDARSEVLQPMLNLQRLAAPINWGYGFLIPPGPTPWDQQKNRNEIFFGNFCYIDSVAIISVTNTFDTRMDSTGSPISGMCQLNLKTMYVPSRDNVLSWFGFDPQGNYVGISAAGSPSPYTATGAQHSQFGIPGGTGVS